MKEQQLLLGTSVFPMAWILWNSPARLIALNKNALIHLARLIDKFRWQFDDKCF